MPRMSLLIVALCLLALPALAEAIYNNFGSDHDGWDYDSHGGAMVTGVDVPSQNGYEQATAFTASVSGTLSDIWVAMGYVLWDDQYDEVTMSLVLGPIDQPPRPDNVLAQWTMTDFGLWTNWNLPHHLAGDGSVELVTDIWAPAFRVDVVPSTAVEATSLTEVKQLFR